MTALTRKILLCAFLALSLVGVQTLAHSPLHHHAVHTVDCGLCHAAHGAPVPVTHGIILAAAKVQPVYHLSPRQVYSRLPYPRFLSRAPPASHG